MPADHKPGPIGVRERFPDLYAELRKVAAAMIDKYRPVSLVPTELVSEAFMRLSAEEARRRAGGRSELGTKPAAEFKACFGAACRDVVIEYWRRRNAQVRGGDRAREPLSTSIALDGGIVLGAVEVDEAISTLEALDPLLALIVEARLFGGLTMVECAQLTGEPLRTVERKWTFARDWLRDRLG